MPIFQRPGSNAIAISDAVRAKMQELKRDFPQGVDYQIVYDPTVFVRGSIHAVVHTLLEAIVLVVLVVIVFLQTWRASVIPLIAVPVSLVGTFAVMYVFGFSLNALSLFVRQLHRYRGRRCHRGRGECRAQHRSRAQTYRGDPQGDARGDFGLLRCDGAGALRGIRAHRVHQRPHRPVLQAIRADHRHQHGDFRIQFVDAVARAVGAAAQGARRCAGSAHANSGSRARGIFPSLQSILRALLGAPTVDVVARVVRAAGVAHLRIRRSRSCSAT